MTSSSPSTSDSTTFRPARASSTPPSSTGRKAFEVIIGIFFVLAASAYWIIERDRAVDLVCSLLPRPRRKTVRDTWDLIELRLGAFVRGQSVLVALVAIVLSACFWAIGLPYWLLVGIFAGIVEIVPVIGPLAAGIVAIGRRALRVSPPRRARRARRRRRPAARGLRRAPARARALGRPLAARRARLGDHGRTRARRFRGHPRSPTREPPRHADRHRRTREGSRPRKPCRRCCSRQKTSNSAELRAAGLELLCDVPNVPVEVGEARGAQAPRALPGNAATPRLRSTPISHGPEPDPQLLDHRPHRPREVDARRPDPPADGDRRRARHARPAARLDGSRARARHHDQGAGGARRSGRATSST